MWQLLVEREKIYIHFAHQTFKWSNEAKGNAAVYCIIIGFAKFDTLQKRLFEYEDIKGEPHERIVTSINPFLVEGKNIYINARTNPVFNVPAMMKGNAAIDDGNFLFFEESDAENFIRAYPDHKKFVRKFIGSDELINNYYRHCLWLKNATPNELKSCPEILRRINNIKKFRSESKKAATRKWADYPSRFMEDRQPDSDYLMIPVVSSELRTYIPVGFLSKDIIANYSSFILPNAKVYHFGMIACNMHTTWIKYVCGRLKSDIRYSNTIGYNNYPWPESPTDKQKEAVEKAAQAVLDARLQFPNSSLADLYDPNTMPPVLVKAHQQLDKAVDLCYRHQPFINETKRIEFLFELYDKYTAGLFVKEKKGKKK